MIMLLIIIECIILVLIFFSGAKLHFFIDLTKYIGIKTPNSLTFGKEIISKRRTLTTDLSPFLNFLSIK